MSRPAGRSRVTPKANDRRRITFDTATNEKVFWVFCERHMAWEENMRQPWGQGQQ